MAQPPNDPWLIGFVNAVVLASAGAWIFIVARWRQRGEVLAYEPRRPVPWGPPAILLALVFVLLALLTPLLAVEAAADAEAVSLKDTAVQLFAFLLTQVMLCGGFFLVIFAVYRPTWDDLGLPRSGGEAWRDVVIGGLTCLAALLPVHGVLVVLQYLSGQAGEITRHPLVEMVTSSDAPSMVVMLLASVQAAVVAPICEEITFRLLLQGWLEKWEDERLGWRTAPDAFVTDVDAGPVINHEVHNESSLRVLDTDSSFGSLAVAPRRGVAGLPYGWLPIFVSSLLFGLAHFGYGPEPVPLLVFGIFLGYVYHRTHRIVPCIVAHALFNLFTIVLLWRMVFHGVE